MTINKYLQRLPGKENVKVVVMDLSETYRNIVKHYFPNARIVADRFHVIRLVNYHLLSVWKKHDELGRKNRGLISLMRRHQWNLRPEQQLKLQEYLNQYPVLDALYHAKQKLVKLFLLKNQRPSNVKKYLPELLTLIDQFMNSPAQAMAKTLLSWIEPIVRMWRFNKSNGMTEGFHTKMEMISRRAFGFRNFENYRLRVLALCGWDGVINRV